MDVGRSRCFPKTRNSSFSRFWLSPRLCGCFTVQNTQRKTVKLGTLYLWFLPWQARLQESFESRVYTMRTYSSFVTTNQHQFSRPFLCSSTDTADRNGYARTCRMTLPRSTVLGKSHAYKSFSRT
ncbi:hypothetical protein BT93_I1632 [Corymbia citriodora subsp. variegata]|nr:hypothetical protein BT93_I1632 [Corymbia citriodora subsp. variegata]